MVDLRFIEGALKVKPYPKNSAGSETIRGFSTDSREIKAGECFVALEGEKFDGHKFIPDCHQKGIRCFITHKSYKNKIKKRLPESVFFLVSDTQLALAKLASNYKNNIFSSILAITGSSGKTTTRELVVRFLSKKYRIHTAKKNFNNEIGLPLTILDAPEHTHHIVLEMGMNHKGEIKRLAKIARPLAALITNIGYAHIGNLGSLEAIADAKAEVFDGMDPSGFVFLNRDDVFFDYLRKICPCEVLDFGISDLEIREDLAMNGYRLAYAGLEFDYPLAGKHNLSNLAAALKVGEFYRISPADMLDSLREIRPVSGRSEVVQKKFTLINDCYNANPSSMIAGLELLGKAKGRRIAILSDMLELGHLSADLHKMVGRYIGENKPADVVLAYGENSKVMIESIKTASSVAGKNIRAEWAETKEKLLGKALAAVQPDDTVLIKASRGMQMETISSALLGRE